MTDKYIALSSGNMTEVASLDSSSGAGDAGKIVALDSNGKLNSNMLPTGVGADTKSLVTSESLAAGDLVNVWNDAGTPKARKADATSPGKPAHGFVLAGVTAPAAADVYFDGTIVGLSALTAGSEYYLSTTAGGITATAITGAGNISQRVGVALSTTELSFEPYNHVTLAA